MLKNTWLYLENFNEVVSNCMKININARFSVSVTYMYLMYYVICGVYGGGFWKIKMVFHM